MPGLFSSLCCSNKLPQPEWLKTAWIYSLTIQEVRILKWFLLDQNSGVSGLSSFPEALGENLLLCLFQFLEADAFLGLWPLPLSSKAAKSSLQPLLLASHSLSHPPASLL